VPAEIDTAHRLSEIAEATLAIARDQGPDAITIRAVAARMGGSTTVVTKFIPSRGALLVNAIQYVNAGWDEDLAAALEQRAGRERLRALIDWLLGTEGHDYAVRRLWSEILAKEDPGAATFTAIRAEAHEEHDLIRQTLEESGVQERPWLTDLLFLACRGYYVSTVEDGENWPGTRARAAVHAMLDAVLGAEESGRNGR
jgi:AcrR family transcriptional regulator